MTPKASTPTSKEYHRSAMTRMSEFLARYEDQSQSVDTMLDSQAQRVIDRNKQVIESLFRVAILCGKQGLAMRGHRDDKVQWGDAVEGPNEGNFVQLVRFRAETDKVLADHLSKGPKNTRYTSKTIHNELVRVAGDKIRTDILEDVKHDKFCSIIADEVTDATNKEELSLVIRYVHEGQSREVFVDFVEVERSTGRVLGEAILKWLRDHKIPPADMRGQCYDGASNMAGARSGVKAVVQEFARKAMYFHCAAHRLNLSVVSACSIQAFKNAESYVGEIARFSVSQPRDNVCYTKPLKHPITPLKLRKVKGSCRTRWVERFDSYAVFLELLPALHTCLQAMVDLNAHPDLGTAWSWDGETITKANGFLFQLQSSMFLVSFQILLKNFQLLSDVMFRIEYNSWVREWKECSTSVPVSLADTLHKCYYLLPKLEDSTDSANHR